MIKDDVGNKDVSSNVEVIYIKTAYLLTQRPFTHQSLFHILSR